MKLLRQYMVIGDPETGEWLTEPQFVGYVIEKEWLEKKDTDLAHFDQFERCDLTGNETFSPPCRDWVSRQNCAIEVRWT